MVSIILRCHKIFKQRLDGYATIAINDLLSDMMPKIPRNVFILGLVSLFNDIASEMIYPIVPIFLTSVLGAPVSVVGLIEGIAEATASIMKFAFGYLSDRVHKRKIFVIAGYSFAAISKLLIASALSWHFVLFARFIDRFGKGLRTAARDSLLLQNATSQNKGFIFGFHRSLDSFGAVVGPLLALFLLQLLHEDMRRIFFFAFFPSIISVFLLFLFVHERKSDKLHRFSQTFRFTLKHTDKRFLFFFFISILFAFGNSSDAFLILRSKNLGFTTIEAVLAYVLYNVSQTIFATPAGKLADKIGAKKVFAYGLLVFSFVYFLFGSIHLAFWVWFLFPIYGLYIAATDGVSKAYIAEFFTEEKSGTYFGLYQTGIAIASFFASFIGGMLWTYVSPSATFFYGSLTALFAFFLLLYGRVKRI